MVDQKLESLAYRLAELNSLRNLFAHLNYDFADDPVNKESWTDDEKSIITEARMIAKKDDYRIYYLQTNTDSLKHWKGISTKIIKENHGLCLICSHNPSGLKWVFSSLSKEFSKSFTETRHIPIDIRPETGVPKTFVNFLEKISITKEDTTTSILAKMSNAFDSFAVEIHDELTVNVFEALKTISEGIIFDKSNNLTLSNETLDEIREDIFILLYRIIFVLYAEDRGIFPIDHPIYKNEFSIKWIKEEWLLKSVKPEKLEEYQVQKRIKKLFRLIEVGSEELDYDKEKFFMRSYYGRIFDRKINHKLEEWNIPNSNFLEILSLLSRNRDKKGNYFFLDYSALQTRHLGSIYEHLLEFHLHVENNKIAELPNPKDRKSSGSYYTPEYIVDYIIQNSVEPLIKKIQNETVDKFEQIEKILSLNILDPAMGSGHFLIGAINYIASRICEIENGQISEQHLIERKREVARRCVYGVDLNPLAVDLAMVSIWLETLSSDKPLSFLSAHLKCGNSLLGSQIDVLFDKQTTLMESQKGREQFKKTIKEFLMFENLDDDSTSAVRTKIERYQSIQLKGTIYYNIKSLLDCKVAESFGVKIPVIADFKAKIGENSLDFFTDESWGKIQRLSTNQRFFHWDLEFPDIFYDNEGNKKDTRGFDVVLGNPPYVRIQTLEKNQVNYFNENYESPTKNYDIYILFIEKGFKLLSENGVLGFVLPHKFFQGESGENIRKFIYQNKTLTKIVNFGTNQVFEDATTYTCLLFLQKKNNEEFFYKEFNLGEDFKNLSSLNFDKKKIDILNEDKWNFSNQEIQKILGKIKSQKKNFASITKKIFKGSSTGNDEIFLLDLIKRDQNSSKVFSSALNQEIEIENAVLHPFVYGEDIRKYAIVPKPKMLLFPYTIINNVGELIPKDVLSTKYPKTFDYLNKMKDELVKRKVKLDDSNFYKYSAVRSISEYLQPKIMIPDMLVSNRVNIDQDGIYFHGPSIHSVVFNDEIKQQNPYFYLGILNSKIFWFFIVNTSTALRGDAYRLTPEFLNPFCFPEVNKSNEYKYNEISKYVKLMIELKDDLIKNEKMFWSRVYHKFNNQKITQKLEKFYEITFDEFLNELNKISKVALSLKEQEEWEEYFNEKKRVMQDKEKEINQLDNKINKIVYGMYELTDENIKIIEKN